MATLAQIYEWFMTSKKPTQAQFWASWGSFWNKGETIPQSAVSNLTSNLAAKAEISQLNGHMTDTNAHATEFGAKEDKNKKGIAGGYAPLDDAAKIAYQYLNIVNDLLTGGTTSLASAETVKTLKTQIDGINALLTSDNVNLDTVQEIVDAIENVQTSLSTILVNDLTTGGTTKALTAEMGKLLQANKVDKVAGERLISAAEQTKLAGLANVTTTVKTITSANLATQDAAGFVAYINALAVVLVVAANEIVEYQLSDTGRVFKLLLRGRSFGTGQPAITTADVEEITLWMQKDLKLSNYPNTRNDGVISTNKVLSTDASGNLKMYSIATAPAPYMEVLIPDSTLPSTTTNFTIKGAFFTPTMTVSIVGQTINYIVFVSDNLIKVNVTTGAAEGLFAVTLNNGISATYPNALSIVLGTVYAPLASDWEAPTGILDVSAGDKAKVITYESRGTNRWNKIFNISKNFYVRFQIAKTPTGYTVNNEYNDDHIILVKASDNSKAFSMYLNRQGSGNVSMIYWCPTYGWGTSANAYGSVFQIIGSNSSANMDTMCTKTFDFRWIGGVMYIYVDNVLRSTLTDIAAENLKLKVSTKTFDIINIKYIELP